MNRVSVYGRGTYCVPLSDWDKTVYLNNGNKKPKEALNFPISYYVTDNRVAGFIGRVFVFADFTTFYNKFSHLADMLFWANPDYSYVAIHQFGFPKSKTICDESLSLKKASL